MPVTRKGRARLELHSLKKSEKILSLPIAIMEAGELALRQAAARGKRGCRR
jgi:hypothetical protein